MHPRLPPVFLLGGLNLLRAIGFAGLPAVVATRDPRDPALASRYCRGRWLLPDGAHRDATAESVLAAGDKLMKEWGAKPLLVYGNDAWLDLIYSNRAEIEQRFHVLLNEPALAARLIDKDEFELLAAQRGVPIPRRYTFGDELEAVDRPLIAKPRIRLGYELPAELRTLFGEQGKARIFRDGREALGDPLARACREQLAFQEYIPGNDRGLWSFHGYCDRDGHLMASFGGRKVRTYPANTGMSTCLEMVRCDQLDAFGRDVVARLGLKGVFKIDLKRDPRDESFRVLEVNARFNMWHHVAARNGINLPAVAHNYLVHGVRPGFSDAPYSTAHRWVCVRLDTAAYRQLARRGELTAGAWLSSLLRGPKVYELFSWTDPRPMLRAARNRVFDAVARRIARLRLSRWPATAS
jgi:predicted ATP-grasp superfamily ATP-dependent carboligase